MCDKDIDCFGSRKCCYNGCQKDCIVFDIVRKLKFGVCFQLDVINLKLCKSTKNECKFDGDCYGYLKCCFNGCFNECFNISKRFLKRGECLFVDYILLENCLDIIDKCDDDL